MDTPETGERLSGGNMSAVVRVSNTVRRTSGPWTPTVHRLLEHLQQRGIDWTPWPQGLDAEGREVLTYLPGTVPRYPFPIWVWEDSVLHAAAAFLAALHDETVGFAQPGDVWQLSTHAPAEVICHNDFAPYNFVFDDARALCGVIDWDTASPGSRVWDVAHLACRLVPLSSPNNADSLSSDVPERRRRLHLLCRAYGGVIEADNVLATAVDRLGDLADLTAERAARGARHVADHVEIYRDDATWLRTHLNELSRP
ncbi:MAG: phosphotransferase family protein [Nocardioidaceae bacterium]